MTKIGLRKPAATTDTVNAERDRRLSSGFSFLGNVYQIRESDMTNIGSAAQAATIAIINNAAGDGNFRWNDPAIDFQWINSANQMVPMDAPTVVEFGQSAFKAFSSVKMAARQLKDQIIAGNYFDDVTKDSLWPTLR